jgi:hypothetical protein
LSEFDPPAEDREEEGSDVLESDGVFGLPVSIGMLKELYFIAN